LHRYRWGLQIRGDERGFIEKAKEYSRKGVKVLVLERAPSMQSEMGDRVYESIIIGDCRIPPRNIMDELLIFLRVLRVLPLKRLKGNLVVYSYNQDPPNALTGYLLKMLLRRRLAIVDHHINPVISMAFRQAINSRRKRGFGLVSAIWKSILPALNRHALMRADIHFAISQSTCLEVRDQLHSPRVVTVGNGVDRMKFRPLHAVKTYDAAFLGRISPQKGIDTLIQAWALVTRLKPEAKLVLIGGGDKTYLSTYSKMISSMGLEKNIHLTGFLSDEELVRTLGSSSLFLFPSRREGFAQAVSQAMASGLCCVLSDIPSLRETYGECAFFVKPDDPEALATTVIELLHDPGKRSSMAEKGLAKMAGYSWTNVVSREISYLSKMAQA
jgi:glycosyltransferase involved in cell wall biosynthesis